MVDFEPSLYFLREQLVSSDSEISEGGTSLYHRCIESVTNGCIRLEDVGVQCEIKRIPIKTQFDVQSAALQESLARLAKMSECQASLNICDNTLKKSEADLKRTTESLNEYKMLLKESNKKSSDHETELNELSASVMQDIEDNRVLKSMGVAWVDPGSLDFGTDIGEIRVCGAGIKEVNGLYTLIGLHNDHYLYQKGAKVNGKKTVLSIYVLYQKSTSENSKWWIIGKIIDCKTDEWYYWATFASAGNDYGEVLPPADDTKWSTMDNSDKRPTPSLLFHS